MSEWFILLKMMSSHQWVSKMSVGCRYTDRFLAFSPSAPRTGLQGCLIVIIEGFLIHLDKFLPLNFSTDNLKHLENRDLRSENIIFTFSTLSKFSGAVGTGRLCDFGSFS